MSKLKYLIITILTIFCFYPRNVLAAGNISVSTSRLNITKGSSSTFTITANNSAGRVDISSSNPGVASISSSSIFLDMQSEKITVKGNSVGTTTITVYVSDATTYDDEDLTGKSYTINVNVVEPPPKLSDNNNIKDLSVDGHQLTKVDNNNYNLIVKHDVDSININATPEDDKAQVSGTGNHELQIGENNIEVVVTSESGLQNKINIKVTRKDGYYLDDLESVLKDSKNKDINIIINADSKISKEYLNKIKDSKKTVNFNYYDENKKLIYSWIIDGSKIKNTSEFITTVSYTSKYSKEISKLSNYADGLYINFKHTNKLPEGTKLKLYVGDKVDDNSMINVYHYDKDKKELKLIKNNVKVKNKYIELSIDKGYEHFLTMSNIVDINESSNSTIKIVSIIELTIIVILIIVCFIKIIRTLNNKKNNRV